MAKNHLFIGLGGQGVNSIAALRRLSVLREKQFQELLGDETTRNPRCRFDYLVIDSNRPTGETQWSALGKKRELDQNQIVDIPSSNLPDVRTLSYNKNIQPWLNDIDKITKKLGASGAIAGAGQMRRFGRVLGAANGKVITDAILEATQRFSNASSGLDNCAFHIFATCGGGTGSGTLVDVVSFIRDYYTDNQNFPIYLYLYIASEKTKYIPPTAFFFANQYSVLRDLNAINTGKYEPDLALLNGEAKKLASGLGRDGINQILISCDYIGSSTSKRFGIALDKQIDQMAEVCFNRIYAMDAGNANDDQRKSITGEDLFTANPGEPNNTDLQRSYRFATACVKRWLLPIEECKENLFYLAYVQLLNKWIYNHWEDGSGYTNLPGMVPAQVTEELAALLSPEGLGAEWAKQRESYITAVKAAFGNQTHAFKQKSDRGNALDLYKLACDNVLQQGLVDEENGVEVESLSAFTTRLERQIGPICEAVKARLLAILDRGITDFGLENAKQALLKAKGDFDNMRNALVSNDKTFNTQKNKILKTLEWRSQEQWPKLTLLSSAVGKGNALCKAHETDCFELARCQIIKAVGDLLPNLYKRIDKELNLLLQHVDVVLESLQKVRTDYVGKLTESSNALANLESDFSVKYEFNPQHLTEITEAILNDRSVVESALKEYDAVWPAYAKNVEYASGSTMALNKLYKALEGEAGSGRSLWMTGEQLHNNVILNNPKLRQNSLLGGSLLNRLKVRNDNDPEGFKKDLQAFVGNVLPGAAITPIPGLSYTVNAKSPSTCMSLGVPGDSDFAGEIKEQLQKAVAAGAVSKKFDYTSSSENEICLMWTYYWMPVRFIDATANLAKEYNNLRVQSEDGSSTYFVNIDPSGERDERPDLMYDPAQQSSQNA